MLGVCRGLQLMNVAAGGSLWQDFPSQVEGVRNHGRYHTVVIEPDSVLAKIVGTLKWATNSMHHQSIKQVGDGLRVNARTPDDIVEGVERLNNPAQIGVQFHPEVTHGDPLAHKLFANLVECGARFRRENHEHKG